MIVLILFHLENSHVKLSNNIKSRLILKIDPAFSRLTGMIVYISSFSLDFRYLETKIFLIMVDNCRQKFLPISFEPLNTCTFYLQSSANLLQVINMSPMIFGKTLKNMPSQLSFKVILIPLALSALYRDHQNN